MAPRYMAGTCRSGVYHIQKEKKILQVVGGKICVYQTAAREGGVEGVQLHYSNLKLRRRDERLSQGVNSTSPDSTEFQQQIILIIYFLI